MPVATGEIGKFLVTSWGFAIKAGGDDDDNDDDSHTLDPTPLPALRTQEKNTA